MITTLKTWQELRDHMNHKLVMVGYGPTETSIECSTCNEVLVSVDGEDQP